MILSYSIAFSLIYLFMALDEAEELEKYGIKLYGFRRLINAIFSKAAMIAAMALLTVLSDSLDGKMALVWFVLYAVGYAAAEIPGRMLAPAISCGEIKAGDKHALIDPILHWMKVPQDKPRCYGTAWLVLRGLYSLLIFCLLYVPVWGLLYAVLSGFLPYAIARICGAISDKAMKYPWLIARAILGAFMGAIVAI